MECHLKLRVQSLRTVPFNKKLGIYKVMITNLDEFFNPGTVPQTLSGKRFTKFT